MDSSQAALLASYLEARLEQVKTTLTTAVVDAVPRLQGEAKAYSELIRDLTIPVRELPRT